MIRRAICLLLMLCCAVWMTGCSRRADNEHQSVPTLPPAEERYPAPDGDGNIQESEEYRIYLPGRDDQHLVSRSIVLEPANLTDRAEMLLRTLIGYPGDEETRKLGGSRQLDLYGTHPIEISGGVCTINLTSSALQMNQSDLYKNCLAIATTMCELKEVNSVNILVADQSVALDVTGTLAMGTLSAHPGENIPVLWEQMEAKRTPLGEDLSRSPLNSLATLYYPLSDGRGITCTTRMVNFEGQTPQQLAVGLLEAMIDVRRSMAGGLVFPNMEEMLMHEPVTSELADGGRLITLNFRDETEEMLAASGTDLPSFAAAVTFTLTTFIPGIAAVCIRIGNKPITELRSSRFPPITALGGLVTRDAVEPYLMSSTTVYFARNGILCECERPIARQSADNPRAQLCALIEGPDTSEQNEGMVPTLPDSVREDDILGIAVEGDTLLVNLSEGFRSEIQDQGKEAEILICYSMVNTLCKNTGLKRVRFYFEGEQVEYISGEIYWAGEFMYNVGLAEKGLG